MIKTITTCRRKAIRKTHPTERRECCAAALGAILKISFVPPLAPDTFRIVTSTTSVSGVVGRQLSFQRTAFGPVDEWI
jgi:hypothetical protein